MPTRESLAAATPTTHTNALPNPHPRQNHTSVDQLGTAALVTRFCTGLTATRGFNTRRSIVPSVIAPPSISTDEELGKRIVLIRENSDGCGDSGPCPPSIFGDRSCGAGPLLRGVCRGEREEGMAVDPGVRAGGGVGSGTGGVACGGGGVGGLIGGVGVEDCKGGGLVGGTDTEDESWGRATMLVLGGRSEDPVGVVVGTRGDRLASCDGESDRCTGAVEVSSSAVGIGAGLVDIAAALSLRSSLGLGLASGIDSMCVICRPRMVDVGVGIGSSSITCSTTIGPFSASSGKGPS